MIQVKAGWVGAARGIGALVVFGLVVTGCAAGRSSDSADHSSPADTYGSLPSFLPSPTFVPDSVLTGSTAHPALTVQGDAVDVIANGFAVRVTVSGPVVPGEGLPFVSPATTCTWTVTMSDPTADVPIDIADFTAIDHLGHVYAVAPVAELPAPPATLLRGQNLTLTLRAVMPAGEGLMRWAPDGQLIVASWDFEVEND